MVSIKDYNRRCIINDINDNIKMKIDLRRFRKDRGLSQTEIGSMFGTGQTNISMLENGNRDLTQDQYQILIDEFGESEILKYEIKEPENEDKLGNEFSLKIDALEIINSQIRIISSQQDVIKSQQNTIDYLLRKGISLTDQSNVI